MNWNDITIEQYQKLHLLSKEVFELEIDKELQTLSIVYGVSVDELENKTSGQLAELSRKASFLSTELPTKLTVLVKIGKRYRIMTEANKLTAQQFILLNKFTKDEDTTVANLHYIMAVISSERRRFKKDLPFDHEFEDKAQKFKGMSIATAYPVALFFCVLYKKLQEATLNYLDKQRVKIEKTRKKLLKTVGSENIGDTLPS